MFKYQTGRHITWNYSGFCQKKALLDIFIYNLDDGLQSSLIQSVNDNRLGNVTDNLGEGSKPKVVLRNRLEIIKMIVTINKFKLLHLGKRNQKRKYKMGNNWLNNRTAEEHLEITVGLQLNISIVIVNLLA